MRMKRAQRREPPENTVPLINVVFLMLIFFLFAGSISKDEARQIEPPINIVEDETIRSTGALVVDPEGKIYFGDVEISVVDWLTQQVGTEDGPLKVAADGDLKADVLEKLIAELKASGRTDIVLITRRGSK